MIVALPEEMPVNESATLEAELSDSIGVAIVRIYMNALYPERSDADEQRRLADELPGAEGDAAAAIGAAIDVARRAASQRESKRHDVFRHRDARDPRRIE